MGLAAARTEHLADREATTPSVARYRFSSGRRNTDSFTSMYCSVVAHARHYVLGPYCRNDATCFVLRTCIGTAAAVDRHNKHSITSYSPLNYSTTHRSGEEGRAQEKRRGRGGKGHRVGPSRFERTGDRYKQSRALGRERLTGQDEKMGKTKKQTGERG